MAKEKGSSLLRNESVFYAQVRAVIVEARRYVHKSANVAMVKAYWLVGKMIVEQQGGAVKAAYGDGLIDALAERLTAEFGAGFTRSNLRNMRQFYLRFENCHTLCGELSWSHLCTDKGSDLVRYTLPLNERRIFAAKYKLVLPTEEQLLAEIRREQEALEETTLIGQAKRIKKRRAK